MSEPRHPLLPRTALVTCLVAAPVLEVVEQLLSPLTGTSTGADLAAIEAHQTGFVVSVLCGMAAVVLYVPGFVGLSAVTAPRSPRMSRIAASCAIVSMLGFFGVRMLQAVQLQLVREPVSTSTAAGVVDHTVANPVGAVVLVLFLGGSLVGLLTLAAAVWRAGFPRPAAVLLGLFPVLDASLPGHLGTVLSHAVVLVALTWIGRHLLDDGAQVGDPAAGALLSPGRR